MSLGTKLFLRQQSVPLLAKQPKQTLTPLATANAVATKSKYSLY